MHIQKIKITASLHPQCVFAIGTPCFIMMAYCWFISNHTIYKYSITCSPLCIELMLWVMINN